MSDSNEKIMGGIIAGITAVAGWFFGKKKRKVELTDKEFDLDEKRFDRLKEDIVELIKKGEVWESKYNALLIEAAQLKGDLAEARRQIIKLKYKN